MTPKIKIFGQNLTPEMVILAISLAKKVIFWPFSKLFWGCSGRFWELFLYLKGTLLVTFIPLNVVK